MASWPQHPPSSPSSSLSTSLLSSARPGAAAATLRGNGCSRSSGSWAKRATKARSPPSYSTCSGNSLTRRRCPRLMSSRLSRNSSTSCRR
uniref:Putative secreted protein n=1 Tax=Ixodes ricinus TaxID=34613 RepID=A0A6B0UGC6_IXORI